MPGFFFARARPACVRLGDREAACAAESEDFLKAPSVNGSDRFSQCSIEQMGPEIAGAACITVLPTVDMTISQQGTVSSVLLGGDVTVTFNEGLRINSAAWSLGSCTVAAQQVGLRDR